MKRNLSLILFLLAFANFLFAQSTNTATYGDYTLYAPQSNTKAYLVDMTGAVYHTWTFSSKKTAYSTYMLKGGTLLRTVENSNQLNGGGMTGGVQKVDWNGTVTWDYVYSSATYCLHHDICPLPNGNVLMISYDVKTAADASLAGCSKSMIIWSEKIIEVQQTGATTGTIVWEWHLWDHLCQSVSSTKNNYVTSVVQHPELMNINYNTAKDWIHMNGIDYNADLDQIVVSSHMLNEIYVIDHSTTTAVAATHTGGNSGKGGDFLYRWGNPASYGATGTTDFNVVHDAHWVPANCPKANYLVAFNNKGGTGTKSCIDMIKPPYNGNNYSITSGSAYLPATFTWRHLYSGTATQDMGNSQQLPNGNTLVCIAMSGYIYEIDSNQIVVWTKSAGGTIPQAFRYTACYTSGTEPTVTASANDKTICAGTSVQLNAAASGGSSYTYLWKSLSSTYSSTDQNPAVTPAATTTYIVAVTSGGCTATSSVTVVVNSLPAAPAITRTGNTLNSSAVSGNQWYVDSVLIPTANSQAYTPSTNGNYQVQLTDSNHCNSPLSAPYNFITTGIQNENSASVMIVYPNPASVILRVEGNAVTADFRLYVYDIYGNQLLSFNNEKLIDISSLTNGIYILVCENKGSITCKSKFSVLK